MSAIRLQSGARFFVFAVAFLCALRSAVRADAEEPLLEPGLRFTTSIKFSNYWSGANTSSGANTGAPAVAASDPLHVTFTLKGEIKSGTRIALAPDFSEIHYFDSRGTEWKIEKASGKAQALAANLVGKLSAEWREQAFDPVRRELIEEQLLGAGLFFLDGLALDVEVPSRNGDPIISGVDELLAANLPAAFPPALREGIAWFLAEAVTRAVAPAPGTSKARGTFECRGTPYSVVHVARRGNRETVSVSSRVHRPDASTTFKDGIVLDPRTGLVLEGESLTIRDPVYGNTERYGQVRWQSKLLAEEPGAKR